MTHEELLDACVARLSGEYRSVLRPNTWPRWVKAVEPGWMPVTHQQVLQAVRGLADDKALTAALLELQTDPRLVLLLGEPLPDLSEPPHEPTFFFL